MRSIGLSVVFILNFFYGITALGAPDEGATNTLGPENTQMIYLVDNGEVFAYNHRGDILRAVEQGRGRIVESIPCSVCKHLDSEGNIRLTTCIEMTPGEIQELKDLLLGEANNLTPKIGASSPATCCPHLCPVQPEYMFRLSTDDDAILVRVCLDGVHSHVNVYDTSCTDITRYGIEPTEARWRQFVSGFFDIDT